MALWDLNGNEVEEVFDYTEIVQKGTRRFGEKDKDWGGGRGGVGGISLQW